ncbi:hypothetical protein CAPTEDRAFT_185972 [Capitella teleta]|uniref:Uncharacterized protein n=1 Tax=Capitella teleta TaxID=283909 RepID=R7TXK1_CAPTE|nr:hypothetical protein CAPTEDRAFT_185972 [Capitella teleta]|eukprot:ELT96176.1 hypothetical protein CAPTEDRAFT_185972 [Capitella teleta]
MAITIKKIITKCCQNSSMKALPRIIKAPTKFQKALWILGLLCGLLTSGYQLSLLFLDYFNFSTSVSIAKEMGAPPFPDVTICHLDKNWTFRMLEREFGGDFSVDEYNYKISELQTLYPSEGLSWGLLESLKGFKGYLQNDFLIHEEVEKLRRLFVIDCSVIYNWDPQPCFSEFEAYLTTNVFLDPEFGMCVTFSAVDDLIKELKLLLYLDDPYTNTPRRFTFVHDSNTHTSAVGAKVVIHPPKSFPDIWLGSRDIYAGNDVSFGIESTKRSVLGEPYGSCIMQTVDDPQSAINRHGYECYRMCARDQVLESCGCINIYYATTKEERNTTPLCGTINLNNITETFYRLRCAEEILVDLNDIMEEVCPCPTPCTQFTYDYSTNAVPWPAGVYHRSFYEQYIRSQPYAAKFHGYADLIEIEKDDPMGAVKKISELNLIEKNFAQLRIMNHQNDYYHYVETPLISREAMFGNVGGLMNLWAGITFITIVEILDFMYQLITKGTTGDEE